MYFANFFNFKLEEVKLAATAGKMMAEAAKKLVS